MIRINLNIPNNTKLFFLTLLGCRTAPNLEDIALAFVQLGIQINELQDYIQQVEPCPAAKPLPNLQPESTEKETRLLDFSGEDFLPPLVDISVKEEENIAEEVEANGMLQSCIF